MRSTASVSVEPMTRVGGAVGVHAESNGTHLTDAHVTAGSFRGYENIIEGRDPRDAMALSSRACGWCGGVHQTTSSMALEMAWGLQPYPMAIAMRNIAQATEAIWVHAAHLAVRAGPDYSAAVVKETTPWVWDAALATEAPNRQTHGYDTIADIMEALTPMTGSYWGETVPTGRRVLEMVSYLYGKYPHPSVLSPGGVSTTFSLAIFTEYYTRLYKSVDYVKRQIGIWDDLVDFLAEADPRFAELGERSASFIHAGAWDDAETYDATYANADHYGRRRLACPGVVLDGEQVTGSLREVAGGIEESVARSFYEDWGGRGSDPEGAELPPGHPWHKETSVAPGRRDFDGRYSWCTAPRWNGHVVESTPLGRLWLTALRTDMPANDFIESTGDGVRILVPRHFLPEMTVEWKIPRRVNALERLRADAYGVAFAGLSAANALLKGFELTRSYRTKADVDFEVLDGERMGVGLWESGRGMNTHWIRTDKRRITGYQIVSPSTWNGSPRDAAGKPGPIEEALIGSPVMEEGGDGRLKGLDAQRVLHSFDPCMNCGTH